MDEDEKIWSKERAKDSNNQKDISPDNFMKNISKIADEKLYDNIKNNPKYFDYIKNNLLLKDKVDILERLSDKVIDKSQTSLRERYSARQQLKNSLFKAGDDKDRVKDQIKPNKNQTDGNKVNTIRNIEKYYYASDIMRLLWYDPNKIFKDNKVLNQSKAESKIPANKWLYQWIEKSSNSESNVLVVTRTFFLKFLGAWEQEEQIRLTWWISEENRSRLREYWEKHSNTLWLIKTLSYLDNNSLEQINKLIDNWLFDVFLDKLVNDPALSTRLNGIMAYDVDKSVADKVAWLLVTEWSINNIIAELATSSINSEKYKNSDEYKQSEERAKNNIWIKYLTEKQWLDDLTITDIREKWNNLSRDEQKKYIILWSKDELDKEIKKEVVLIKTDNYQKESWWLWVWWVVDAYDFAKKEFAQSANLEEQEQFNKRIDQIQKENDQNLYLAAEKYWFTQELRQVRWEDYYKQVGSNYIQQYDKTYGEKQIQYQNSPVWKAINKQIFGSVDDLKAIFWNNEITKTDLKWSLSDQEYFSYLDKIYPSQNNQKSSDILNPNKQIDTLEKTKKEDALYNDTNEVARNAFKDRVVYFLADSLNINLDDSWKSDILKSINFDQWSQLSTDKKEISLVWNLNGEKVRISYNIDSWEVKIWQWLWFDNNSKKVDIDKSMKTLSSIKWPQIDSFYGQAKNINYSDLLKDPEINSWTKLQSKLNDQLKAVNPISNPSDIAKNEIKTEILKAISSQEVLDMIWLKDKIQLEKWIDWAKNPLYPLLFRSLSSYNQDQLNQFRSVVKNMADYYDRQNQLNSSNNPKDIDSKLDNLSNDISDEKYSSLKSITKKIFSIKEQKNIDSDYIWEQFYPFFMSFLSDNYISQESQIIDTEKFYTYMQDLNQSETKTIDKEYFWSLQENMQRYFADTSLEQKISLA